MEEKVLKIIQKYEMINLGEKVIVAVSGGPDSLCLLTILLALQKQLKLEIIVVHINHAIREEADAEEQFVEEFCKQRKIPFFSKKIEVLKVAKQEKIGIEEAGRKVRYEFLEEVLQKQKADKVAIAHTANDNAETVLMHFIRGCGITGLTGIQPIREQKYIKPLIECTRKEVEDYCQEKNLQPRMDSTNLDNTYTRNRIRNTLLPFMETAFNPNILHTLNRTAQIARENEEYFNQEILFQYKTLVITEQSDRIELDLKKFNEKHCVIKNRIVLYTINRLLGNTCAIERKHLEDILKLCQNNIGNKYLIPNKKIRVSIRNKKIIFEPNPQIP